MNDDTINSSNQEIQEAAAAYGVPRERLKLELLALAGFKSIGTPGQEVRFGDVTVLLGANGAGKSNLISFFQLLNFLTSGALQKFVVPRGGAESLLHFGPKTTECCQWTLRYLQPTSGRISTYKGSLRAAAGGRMVLTDETVEFRDPVNKNEPQKIMFAAGLESLIISQPSSTIKVVRGALSRCRVYQFHDTSPEAKIRQGGYKNDNAYLRSDGGNLAAFLAAIKNHTDHFRHYQRIVRHIQSVIPQFDDFILEPMVENPQNIMLDWKVKGHDYRFGPHQLSDGSLRFMALVTLFLQPPETMPSMIIVDEPELGLHPAALAALAGMVRSASKNCQVLFATQSSQLVNEFEVEEIVVVDQDAGSSRFQRLERGPLAEWLASYSLAELWDKNVLGGRP
jgi:predicted ATPase